MTFTALVATFDTATAEVIKMATTLFSPQLSNPFPQPHCTLAIYDNVPFSEITETTLAQELPKNINIHLPAIGLFFGPTTQTLFVALSPSEELFDLQKRVTHPFAEKTSQFYQSKLWYPHATVALNIPHTDTIPTEHLSEILQLPLQGNIVGITVTELSEDRTELLQQKEL